MELLHLHYFREVAAMENITKAAKETLRIPAGVIHGDCQAGERAGFSAV